MTDEPIRSDPFLRGAHSDTPEDRARRYSIKQPQCDRCWFRENPDKRPHREGLLRRQWERCSGCGSWTRSGIYVICDVKIVPYPSILVDGERERF